MSEHDTPRPDQGATPRDDSAAPANPTTTRTGLLTYSPDTGAATYVSDGTQVALGKHQTLFDAYAAAREDGHRPSRWMTRLGGVTLRLDHADHWDRMFDAKLRGSRS